LFSLLFYLIVAPFRRRVRLVFLHATPPRRYVMAFSFFILIEQQTI